jgi:uncharacterized protein DUF3891
MPSAPRARHNAFPIPAWHAVETKQKQAAHEWWVITQPDHAALAGDIAARLDQRAIPTLSAEVIRAISAHDAGWAAFDLPEKADLDHLGAAAAPAPRPLSFLEIPPRHFLVAWTDSIAAAERIGAVGGIIVSEHFSRLARSRLASRKDAPEDVGRLEQFLADESCRQARLRNQVQASPSQLEALTDVLQFCDLVSLYLCCGADEPAEFPQQFGGTMVQVRCEGDAFLFTPPVFGRGAALGVSARRYPGKQFETLPLLLA